MDSNDRYTTIVQIVGLAIVALYIFWIFLVPPIMAWISANSLLLMVLGVLIVAGVVGLGYWWRREDARAAGGLAREREYADFQRQRGLEEYQTREGKVVWVSQDQLEEVARRDREEAEAEARRLVNRLTSHIEAFEPSRDYASEWEYHLELQGYLKAVFPDARIEVQTGASRPDIVVDDIAIEVKGPTNSRDLQTIADKLVRYSLHYDTVLVVLFHVQVSDLRYREWEEGIMRQFGDVRIIRI